MSAKPFGAALWVAIPLVLWATSHNAARLEATPPSPPAAPCKAPPVTGQARLWPGQQTVALPLTGPLALTSHATLAVPVCGPGALSVRASGSAAAGKWPLMTVSLDTQPLLTTRVSSEREWQVGIPHAGWLTISFHNDLYLPDTKPPQDSNLFLKAVVIRETATQR